MIRNEEEIHQFDHEWEMSRKTFLRSILLGSIAFSLPMVSCKETDKKIIYSNIDPLTQKQFHILRKLQNALFPSTENAPGALDVSADRYFLWVVSDPRMNSNLNDFLIQKLEVINDEVYQQTGYEIEDVSDEQLSEFLNEFSKSDWKKRWVSRMLTLIFEALLLDPIYGANTDQIGWSWLNFEPGFPRIKEEYMYPQIFEALKNDE